MRNKKYSANMKVLIVTEGMKENTPIIELCRKYDIAESTYYEWRKKFLEGAKKAFASPENHEVEQLRRKIEDLERIIGRQTIKMEMLLLNNTEKK